MDLRGPTPKVKVVMCSPNSHRVVGAGVAMAVGVAVWLVGAVIRGHFRDRSWRLHVGLRSGYTPGHTSLLLGSVPGRGTHHQPPPSLLATGLTGSPP